MNISLGKRALLGALASAGLAGSLVVGVVSTGAASAATSTVTTMSARAYSVAGVGLLNLKPTPDSGSIVSTVPERTQQCVVGIPGAINAGVACAQTEITAADISSAQADVAQVNVGALPGIPAITVSAAASSSSTSCTNIEGATSIAYVQVGFFKLAINGRATPNDTINLGFAKIILNEEIAFNNGIDHGFTVNAVHIIIPGVENLVVASSTSDIGNCPAAP